MNWFLLCRLLGLLGMLVGSSMIFSLPWAFPACGEAETFEAAGFRGIVASIVVSLTCGGALFLIGRRAGREDAILRKEALAVVGLGWLFAGLLGSLPFLFSGTLKAPGDPMTVVDAVFESISGFTTTGASVLTELEDPLLVPRCVLFWRSFTHWLGGMGIIVLFVAILRQLGVGGKALLRQEVSGPIHSTVRPRVWESAVLMWIIYMFLSALSVLAYVLEGMSLYDALCHTFGAIATGGFSTRNASIGHFNSPLIEATTIVVMILGGTNFALYYFVIHRRTHTRTRRWRDRLAPLLRDTEYRAYLCFLAVAIGVLAIDLRWRGAYEETQTALRDAAFTVVSIMTATGFATADFDGWSEFAKALLLLLMFIGGCAGSTSGGTKVIRVVLFVKMMRLEIERAFRPNVVRPLRLAGKPLDDAVRHDVVVYVALVLFVFVSGWMLLAAVEPDTQWQQRGDTRGEKLIDCASAVAATFNTVGPGLGVLGPRSNYAGFSEQGKVILTLLMLLGRLELFAILVLFSPAFWRSQ